MAGNAVTRDRLFSLRETIARIEGKSAHEAREGASLQGDDPVLSVQAEAWDQPCLLNEVESVLRAGALVELRSDRLADAGAASGLALAFAMGHGRPVAKPSRLLLIGDRRVAREAGLPYAPGLKDFGLAPGELVHALPRRIEDALWLAEAALGCGAFSAVLLEVEGNPRRFGLTESRRLSLRAREQAVALLLIRQGGEEEATSASIRLRVTPAPAAARVLGDQTVLGGGIGNPVFHVVAEKSRSASFPGILLEWKRDDRRLCPIPSAEHDLVRRAPDPGAAFPRASDRPDRTGEMGAVMAFHRAS